ncbi:hypothetical protein ABPG72_007663 [Tetrahymena utriculariae]
MRSFCKAQKQAQSMNQSKWRRLYQNILLKGFQEEQVRDYIHADSLKSLNILTILFLFLFQLIILISAEYDETSQNIRIIVCTLLSIIVNLLCCTQLNKEVSKFRHLYFISLVLLWIGTYYNFIDQFSSQILQKSAIVVEIQIYFCYFVVNNQNFARLITLIFGYTRIFIGFRFWNEDTLKQDVIGVTFFAISFMLIVMFIWVLKQNNTQCYQRRRKEQLRYIELQKILDNDIQQGIMIITPKKPQSILSVGNLEVKYVNNCFLNQFNISSSEALSILPLIHASKIKSINDNEVNRFSIKESVQIKQQTTENDIQKEVNSHSIKDFKAEIQMSNQQNSLLNNFITKNNQNQLKPMLKIHKLSQSTDKKQLKEQAPIDLNSVAESTKVIQEEKVDQVHNLPKPLKSNKRSGFENYTNFPPSNQHNLTISSQTEHNSQNVLLSANKQNNQILEANNGINNNNKLLPITSKQKKEDLVEKINQNDQSSNKKELNFFKILNQNSSLQQFNEIVINTNKISTKQNQGTLANREGSYRFINTPASRNGIESFNKNKGNSFQNQPGLASGDSGITLLDKINYYHQKYLQHKEKNLSFSQRNIIDDSQYKQSLVIWEYRKEDKNLSQDQNIRSNNQYPSIQKIGNVAETQKQLRFQSNNNILQINEAHAEHNNQIFSQNKKVQMITNTSVEQALRNTQIKSIQNNEIQFTKINHTNTEHEHEHEHEHDNDIHEYANQPLESYKINRDSNLINLKSEKDDNTINKQDNYELKHQTYQNTALVPSIFLKKSAQKTISQYPSNLENTDTQNNIRSPSMSQRVTQFTTQTNNIQENQNKQNKSVRRISNNSHNLVAKKIDENILEITREQKAKSNGNNNKIDQAEQTNKSSKVDDDEDDEGDDRRYLEIKLFECEMDKEESIMLIVNNINQRIKYERLKEAQMKNQQMLANVTHDLKTPLNCITLMVEGMKLEKQYNEQTIDMILENSYLLMCLIQDILDYSQIKKGKLRLVQQYFYVSEIIQEVINLFQMQADQKNIKLISNIYRSSNSSVNTSSNNNNNLGLNNFNQYQNVNNASNQPSTIHQQLLQTNRNHNNSLVTNNEMQSQANMNEQTKNIHMHQDKNRIKQILINLISNALKFTTEGYIEISCDIKDLEENSNIKIVEFSVKDTGVGMNPHIKSQLFKVFNTFDQKGLNKNGIGLGLTICKRLVTFLGPSDHIDVESEVSKGSKFSFKVYKDLRDINNTHHSLSDESDESPDINSKSVFHDLARNIKKSQNLKEEDQIEDSQLLVNSLPYSNAHPNIKQLYEKDGLVKALNCEDTPKSADVQCQYSMLIVDDQPFNIMAFKIVLKNFKQIAITEAYNGKDAFEKFQKQKFDFVLMDYNMPIMNGYESTKLIRMYEQQNNLVPSKILIVSGFDEKQKEYQKAMLGGADDFLTKPVNFKIITEKLNSYMCKTI